MSQSIESAIEELKKKHKGKITTFIVPLDAEEDEEDPNRKTAVFHIRTMDKTTRKLINTLNEKDNTEGAIIAGLKSLLIGGDDPNLLKDNDFALTSVDFALAKHMRVAATIIKKN